ncbi:MAG: DUF3617 domain-containing protein [Pseudomonadota bacterium]
MRVYTGTALAAALALSACGGETSVDADADGDGAITTSEARAAVEAAGADLKPEPGQYATTMTLTDVNIPGAPPEMAQMMGQAMNRTGEFCLTPEQAERGFEGSLKEGQNEACTIETFTIEGNQVDMAMSCNQAGMGDMAVTMSGEVAPTQSDLTMKMNGTIPQLGAVEMALSFQQKRVGDCAS